MTSTHLPRSIQLDVRSYGRANMTKIADSIASFLNHDYYKTI
jgi:hypothetical protein